MSVITSQQIHKAYGQHVILDEVSLQIYAKEKIGFVGRNGSGKTTLMRILAGQLAPDSGQVVEAKAAAVAYLPQEAEVHSGRTVQEEAEKAVHHLRSMEDAIQTVHERMADTDDAAELSALAEQLDRLEAEFRTSGGYDYERRIEVVLQGLGFRPADLGMSVDHLSGGQKSRLALARLLLESPDMMLLDEPTNHLDIRGVEWLEGYLRDCPSAALIVSHDRYFLDRVANRIVELDAARLENYRGNYSAYARTKADRVERQRKEYEQQREEIARQEEYIRRYHSGQRAKEARGRQKKLDRIERIDRPGEQRSVRIRLSASRRSGDVVCTGTGLTKRFGDLQLFEGLDFEIYRGDRLGIIGPNGSGKTTLLRMVLGQEPPTDGTLRLGHGLVVGYYQQDLAGLDLSRTVFDEVWECDRQATEQDMRDRLAAFLLTGDTLDREVGTLSGGEQCRVALVKLLCQRPNLLLLDEPTNHLDIASRTALEAAFDGYEGTIIMVTHDRYLLNRVAQKVLWVEAGQAQLYHGDYDFVLWRRGQQDQVDPDQAAPRPDKRRAYRERQRAARIVEGPLAKLSFEQLEHDIIGHETHIEWLEGQMADPAVYADGPTIKTVRVEYETAKAELENLNAEWERRLGN